MGEMLTALNLAAGVPGLGYALAAIAVGVVVGYLVADLRRRTR